MTVDQQRDDAGSAPTWLLIARGATMPQVWPIPLIVGTLLTAVNLGPDLLREPTIGSLVAVSFNYLVPYVVSSLGFLRCQRSDDRRGVGDA